MTANRRPSHRRVKRHRNYTVEEIAILFGIHKNTVREWIKSGLAHIDDRRPMLILGQDLASFLLARRTRNKRTCQPGEMYCVRCRAPKMAAGGMADYLPDTDKVGALKAICPDCDCMMNRRVSRAKMAQGCGKLEITFPLGLDQVSNSVQPTVNSDLK
jgi:excisionase family DNA binding protein